MSRRPSPLSRYDALLLTAALWFLAKFLRYSLPALFPLFRVHYGVSNALLGSAFTAMMVAYSLMQFPSGALADRLGPVRIVAAGGVVAACGALVLGVAGPFVVLLAGMLLVGFGTGVHKTVSVDLLSRTYPRRTGRALGTFDAIGALGGVAAPAAVVLATDGDWHALFLLAAVVGLALAGLALFALPHRGTGRTIDAASLSLRPYLAALDDARLALFVVVTLCVGFAFSGVTAFLPLFLVDRGLTPDQASVSYGVLFAASLVQVLTGDLSDRVGRLPLAFAVVALAAGALLALVALGRTTPLAFGVAVFAFGVGAHGFRPIRGSYLSRAFPTEVAGGGLGLVRTLLKGAGALSPAVVGAVADVAGFTVAFALLAGVLFVAGVAAAVAVALDA